MPVLFLVGAPPPNPLPEARFRLPGSASLRGFRVLLSGVLLVCVACGGEGGPTTEPRGIGEPRAPHAATSPRPEPRRPVFQPPLQRHTNPPIRVTERVEIPAPPTPAPPRDLSAELRGLVGGPSGCGDLGDQEEVRLRASAVVTQTGIVTRARVSGVPSAAADCFRRRIEAGRFRGPVEQRTVTAELVFRGTRTITDRTEDVSAGPTAGTGFELQRGQSYAGTGMAYEGSYAGARPIEAAPSMAIQPAAGTEIQPSSSRMIDGPSGTSIR